MAEKGNTKQEILEAALDLFSAQGFEATSMQQIAEAVGIRKPSLYSHFVGKQEILDELVRTTIEQYEKHSPFAQADWDNPDFTSDKQDITEDDVIQMILKHFCYIVHDPKISRSCKMLTIEQFQNPKLKELQTKQNYTDVMRYFAGLVRFLVSRKKLFGNDVEIMRAQLCLPVTVWINLCDREPEREKEITALIERHVRQFFRIHGNGKEEKK